MSKEIIIKHEAYDIYRDVIAMTMPLFFMAFFYYGPRVLVLMLLSWFTARLCDRVAALLRGRKYDRTDNCSVATAFVLLLMLPASVPMRVVIVGVVAAVLIAKEAFGGYGHFPFNPAAVGFCVVAVSWPGEVLRFPQPQRWLFNLPQTFSAALAQWGFDGAMLAEGPSYILKNSGLPTTSTWDLLLGNYAGPMGVTASLVVVACGFYLYIKKRLPLAAPLCFIGVTAAIAFLFPRYSEIGLFGFSVQDILLRLEVVKYEMLSGALLFAAVFLVVEPVTLPKKTSSQAVYGLLLGFATMMFRYFGTYELGACFAFLLVNAFSGYFDRALTRREGRKKEASHP